MIFLGIFLSFFLLFSPFAYAISIPVGGMAPDFTLNSINGKTISLSEYRGKTVVLIYWKTGQDRSLLALKDGKDIFKRYKKKDVRVISLIAGTENQQEVLKVVKDYGIDFPVLLDSGRQVYGDYGIRVYPSTVIIDREGILTYDIPGHSVTYKNALEGYLQYMLGEISQAKMKEIISPHVARKKQSEFEAESRYNLALKFVESGLIDQAVEAVKKSIDAMPDNAKSRILLGFLFIEQKEADKALEEFNKALELNEHSHDAKTGLGSAFILKGEPDLAIDFLKDAIVANPYPQMTYYKLGIAYELKGEKDKAIEMYKKAFRKIIKKRILPSSITKCD